MAFPLRAFTMATLLSVSTMLWATPGALDTTFGTNGQVVISMGTYVEQAYAVAIQPDGKVLAAGFSCPQALAYAAASTLVRYNADGSLDSNFGSGGIVTNLLGSSTRAYGIALQPDGKVVVAGYHYSYTGFDFALMRYNADGSLDTSFGSGGIVTTPIGGHAEAHAIALQRDGKVVVAGYSYDGSNNDVALVRYNADGTLDTSFGSGGVVTTAIGNSNAEATAIALQPDGKVVVAGYSSITTPSYTVIAVLRYRADGSLDTSFGSGGIVTTAIGTTDDRANAIALQPDGKVLAAGHSNNGGNSQFALVRYNATGSLDTSFGSGGIVTTTATGGNSSAYTIDLQPDGKVLAAGYGSNGSDNDFALARYNTNGSLDTGFGTGGIVTTNIGGDDETTAIALQSDGKAVAAGFSYYGGNYNFALVRYTASDTTWDLTPDAISFTDQSNVAVGSTPTSNTITVSGLDAGIEVPVQVSGGSYSLNGGAYTTATGWMKNGDTLTVRQTASSSPYTATNTTLTIGGLVAPNNANVPLGGTVSATFSSTTAAASSGGGGGGAFGLVSLLLLGLFGAFRRRSPLSV